MRTLTKLRGRLARETKAVGGTFLTQWGYNSANLPAWMRYSGGASGGWALTR